MMLNQIEFEYPYAFVVFVVFLFCQVYCKAKVDSLFFPTIKFAKKIRSHNLLRDKIIKTLIAFFMVLSLASPIIKDEISLKDNKGYEISLIVDASGSMAENSKFSIVKEIVDDFLDKRVHDKIGLSVFADFAYVVVPLSYDKKSIKKILKMIEIGVAGSRRTALYEALYLSSNLFKNSKAKKKIVILLTDGKNNVENIPLEVAIKTIKRYGIKVYTIGVGTVGDFDSIVLKKIAQGSGGEFFSSDSKEGLEKIYDTIDKLEKSDIEVNKYVKKRYLFAYPLGFAIFLSMILLFRRHRGLS